MQICNITTAIDGASGVATFVRELDAAIRAKGVESIVVEGGRCSGSVDVLHIHGLWLKMYHRAARWAIENRIPIVWSTHGMTAPWSMHHKWWKKMPAWWLYQKNDLKKAVAIHCTTEQEVEWNKALGFNNCFIAPLGTWLPSSIPAHNSNYTLLFVGRIHPVKGLVNLIKAWKILCSTRVNITWKLRIVGPDQVGHQSVLEALVRELGLGDSVEFPGPKFDKELSAEYDNCDCLILPSFTENFGATIVDAMAHAKPCIASTFTPWHVLVEKKCGWWVSNEPEKLARGVVEMINCGDKKRQEMGRNGLRLVKEKYTWDAVADTMIAKYKEVLGCK